MLHSSTPSVKKLVPLTTRNSRVRCYRQQLEHCTRYSKVRCYRQHLKHCTRYSRARCCRQQLEHCTRFSRVRCLSAAAGAPHCRIVHQNWRYKTPQNNSISSHGLHTSCNIRAFSRFQAFEKMLWTPTEDVYQKLSKDKLSLPIYRDHQTHSAQSHQDITVVTRNELCVTWPHQSLTLLRSRFRDSATKHPYSA